MKFWDHSEDLWENEIKERLRLGGALDDELSYLVNHDTLETWTNQVMKAIYQLDTTKKMKKDCRSKQLE